MELMNLSALLEPARQGGYGVGAFNFCNFETAQAAAEEGTSLRSPIMLIISPMEIELLGAKAVVEIARSVAEDANVPFCLHLDHAEKIEDIEEAIKAGFPSVMIDGSKHDFEENVRLTKAVADMAHPLGVTVEGELGAVGRVGDFSIEGGDAASLTDPAKAAEFVERTGVDALAVAIGNAHGLYTQRPELDFERLRTIRDAVDVPLVLHGGSGTPPEQLHRAISLGISKVNVASEIARMFLDTIHEADRKAEGKVWYTFILMEAKAAARQVVRRWIQELGSAGKA